MMKSFRIHGHEHEIRTCLSRCRRGSAGARAGSPAQAAAQKIQKNTGLIGCVAGYSSTISTANCTNAATNVKRTSRTAYHGHSVISVQFLKTKRCIDSAAQTSGDVHVKACNSGNYQFLEVFDGKKKGTKVLKSIGAWEHQGVHRCLTIMGDGGVSMAWTGCNVASDRQQFTLK